MIYQKTASLMEASAGAAATLAGKSKEPYMKYGKNLGIAFQMIDDLLDITASSDTLGKPALHDFVEGKTTLPYIYLYEVLSSSDKDRLISLHGQSINHEDEEWIKTEMINNGILKKSYDEAKTLILEAIALMNDIGEDDLVNIAMAMIDREF